MAILVCHSHSHSHHKETIDLLGVDIPPPTTPQTTNGINEAKSSNTTSATEQNNRSKINISIYKENKKQKNKISSKRREGIIADGIIKSHPTTKMTIDPLKAKTIHVYEIKIN